MSEVKWIKLVTDLFDNRKIKQIEKMPEGDSIIVIWVKILCLAGRVNDNGLVYFTNEIPYTEEMLATEFNRSLNVVKLALKTFETFGMIEVIDNIYKVSSWEKYQNVEGLERVREQTRKRVAEHRERKRIALSQDNEGHSNTSEDETGCNVTRNVTVTHGNETDIDIEKELEEDIKNKNNVYDVGKKRKTKVFQPPTVDEVRAYCKERNNNIDADYFVDYYTARGWKLSNGKQMVDWKASVRTWERNNYSGGAGRTNKQTGKPAIYNPDDVDITDAFIRL